jgi:kojibiose phosphorylase
MTEWQITRRDSDPAALASRRSAFTISNGYLGLSGHVLGDAGAWPLTLIHGVYDQLDLFGQLRASARRRPWLDERHFDSAGPSPAVAALPDPLMLRVFVDGRELALPRAEWVSFEQRLALDCGAHSYTIDFKDGAGRVTRVEAARFASLRHGHRAYMRVAVTPLNHDAPLTLLAGIDGDVRSNVTRERQFELRQLDADERGCCAVHARLPARSIDAQIGVWNRLLDEGPLKERRAVVARHAAYTRYELRPRPNQPIVLERAVVLASSEDARLAQPVDFEAELAAAARLTYAAALAENAALWRELWAQADVQIDGDPGAQLYLRFCLFHLLAAAPRFSGRLSVPVKLLSGQHYQGTTFYDTDVYIVPFYSFTFPELARRCLRYRIAGLGPARERTRSLGLAGAKLAWQAGPYGEECLGDWYHFTRTNIHINADAAYGLMQYCGATGDVDFLRKEGAELLVESARFYASRAVRDAARDAYDLRDVSGPDEGHCHSDNNFYTNYLAARTLEWAADLLDRARSAGAGEGDVLTSMTPRDDEPRQWRQIAARLPLLQDPRTRVYEQFDGFHSLAPLPPDFLSRRTAWFEPTHPYQALNQPDVLMAMMLFRERFDTETLRANWEFYRDKSLNFSSMSYGVNAIMAAELGAISEAYRDFMISAGMDLDESLTGRRDTPIGLHGTAMGAAWMAAVFGLAGVCVPVHGPDVEPALRITPRLPAHWAGLRFKLALRGEQFDIEITRRGVTVHVGQRAALRLPATIAGHATTLVSGQSWSSERA